MACPFPAEELSAYVDGELGEGQRDRIEEHLHHCARCAQVVASFRAISHHLRAQPEATIDGKLEERVMERVLRGKAPAPMSCAAAQQAASAYIDAELNPRAAARLEAHLFECDTCLRALGAIEVCAAAQQTTPVAPPPRLRARILAAADECGRGWLAGRQWLRRAMTALRLVGPAFAVVLVALGVTVWLQRPARVAPAPVVVLPPPAHAEAPVVSEPETETKVAVVPAAESKPDRPARPAKSSTASARPTVKHEPKAAPTPAPAEVSPSKPTDVSADDFWTAAPAQPVEAAPPAPEVDIVNPTEMAMVPPALERAQYHFASVAQTP